MVEKPPYDQSEDLDDDLIGGIIGAPGEPDSDLFAEILRTFIEDNRSKIPLVEVCAENGDREGMESLFHYVGGAAGNIGLKRFAAACSFLEDRVQETEDPALPGLAHSMVEEYRRSMEAVQKRFPDIEA
mgnify:FL=1